VGKSGERPRLIERWLSIRIGKQGFMEGQLLTWKRNRFVPLENLAGGRSIWIKLYSLPTNIIL
jgi:hypothetical protein